jgi:hypothetical protein
MWKQVNNLLSSLSPAVRGHRKTVSEDLDAPGVELSVRQQAPTELQQRASVRPSNSSAASSSRPGQQQADGNRAAGADDQVPSSNTCPQQPQHHAPPHQSTESLLDGLSAHAWVQQAPTSVRLVLSACQELPGAQACLKLLLQQLDGSGEWQEAALQCRDVQLLRSVQCTAAHVNMHALHS